MNFNTPYNRPDSFIGENYSNVVSITQPDQVLPLKRILDGLKNGTIILNNGSGEYDIPEHEVEFETGRTPEQTNSNIASATEADLAESANKAGDVITAHPGFTIEDAQPTVDAVEAAIIANAEDESGKSAGRQEPKADVKAESETFAASTGSTVSADGAAN